MVLTADRRRALVHAAAREFGRVGFERASLNAILRECAMSKSSFYNVLESKAALYDLVVDVVAGRLSAELDMPEPEALRGQGFWEAVSALVDHLSAVLLGDALFSDLAHMLYDWPAPTGSVSGERVIAAAERWVGRVVSVGRDSGAIRTDLPASLQAALAVAVLRALDEWSVHNVDALAENELPALVRGQFAALQRLLAP